MWWHGAVVGDNQVVSALCAGQPIPSIYSLDVELSVLGLHAARSALGLSDERVEAALAAASGEASDGRRQVLSVVRYSTCASEPIKLSTDATEMAAVEAPASTTASSSGLLQEGDVIIEVSGKLVTRFGGVEAAVDELVAAAAGRTPAALTSNDATADTSDAKKHKRSKKGEEGEEDVEQEEEEEEEEEKEKLFADVTLLRDKKELLVKVPLRVAPCSGTTRMVVLGGLVCQHHHRAFSREPSQRCGLTFPLLFGM
jgi:hypothetical protein